MIDIKNERLVPFGSAAKRLLRELTGIEGGSIHTLEVGKARCSGSEVRARGHWTADVHQS